MSRPIATKPRRCCGAPSSSASTSSTPPTPTAPTSARRSSPRRCTPTPTTSSSRRRAGWYAPGPGRWPTDGRPEHLRDACEGSLRRLRLDQIPLYQFHRPDPEVPLEDSIGALAELKDAGKVRHIGVCNLDEAQLRRAQEVVPIVSVQNRYNVTDRTSESLVDLCEQEQMVFLPWAPILDLDGTPSWERSLTAAASHRDRWSSPGCSPALPPSSPSPGRDRRRTSRATWPPQGCSSLPRRSVRSTRGSPRHDGGRRRRSLPTVTSRDRGSIKQSVLTDLFTGVTSGPWEAGCRGSRCRPGASPHGRRCWMRRWSACAQTGTRR